MSHKLEIFFDVDCYGIGKIFCTNGEVLKTFEVNHSDMFFDDYMVKPKECFGVTRFFKFFHKIKNKMSPFYKNNKDALTTLGFNKKILNLSKQVKLQNKKEIQFSGETMFNYLIYMSATKTNVRVFTKTNSISMAIGIRYLLLSKIKENGLIGCEVKMSITNGLYEIMLKSSNG